MSDGDLFKGRVVFMIEGLKESVSYVIKAIPEVQYSAQLLATKTAECINSLRSSGFNDRSVVNDNHFENVNSFKCLYKNFQSDLNLYIQYPRNGSNNTYVFYDSGQLLKNIRNNSLNTKKFFPEFNYDKNEIAIL